MLREYRRDKCEEQTRAGGDTAGRWKKSSFVGLAFSAQASKNEARPINSKTDVFWKHHRRSKETSAAL